MLRESTLFPPVFGCSWTLPSCYPVERVCPSVLRSPSSPFLHSYVPHWYSLCLSALVHSYHMPPPFPPFTCGCEPQPRCPSYWFPDVLRHTSFCRSIQLAVFSVQISASNFGISSRILKSDLLECSQILLHLLSHRRWRPSYQVCQCIFPCNYSVCRIPNLLHPWIYHVSGFLYYDEGKQQFFVSQIHLSVRSWSHSLWRA